MRHQLAGPVIWMTGNRTYCHGAALGVALAQADARNAVEGMGLVAEFLLLRL